MNNTIEVKTHKVKCWPQYFLKLKTGEKTFEVRLNDRNYKVGDILINQEWELVSGTYTGDEVKHTITYILENYDALKPDFVVMALSQPPVIDIEALRDEAKQFAKEWATSFIGKERMSAESFNLAGQLRMIDKLTPYLSTVSTDKDKEIAELKAENEKYFKTIAEQRTLISGAFKRLSSLTSKLSDMEKANEWVGVETAPILKESYDQTINAIAQEVVITIIVTDGEDSWPVSYCPEVGFNKSVIAWKYLPSPPKPKKT